MLPTSPTPWRALLGPELRELVCSTSHFQWRLARDSSTAHLTLWVHAWEHVHWLTPLPGIDRVILAAEPPACEACRRAYRSHAELGEQLSAVVET